MEKGLTRSLGLVHSVILYTACNGARYTMDSRCPLFRFRGFVEVCSALVRGRWLLASTLRQGGRKVEGVVQKIFAECSFPGRPRLGRVEALDSTEGSQKGRGRRAAAWGGGALSTTLKCTRV